MSDYHECVCGFIDKGFRLNESMVMYDDIRSTHDCIEMLVERIKKLEEAPLEEKK